MDKTPTHPRAGFLQQTLPASWLQLEKKAAVKCTCDATLGPQWGRPGMLDSSAAQAAAAHTSERAECSCSRRLCVVSCCLYSRVFIFWGLGD